MKESMNIKSLKVFLAIVGFVWLFMAILSVALITGLQWAEPFSIFQKVLNPWISISFLLISLFGYLNAETYLSSSYAEFSERYKGAKHKGVMRLGMVGLIIGVLKLVFSKL